MNKKPLDNSDIVVDRSGTVGIINMTNAGCEFYPFDEKGSTKDCTIVDVATLERAPLEDIPASRRAQLADVQWRELGHE